MPSLIVQIYIEYFAGLKILDEAVGKLKQIMADTPDGSSSSVGLWQHKRSGALASLRKAAESIVKSIDAHHDACVAVGVEKSKSILSASATGGSRMLSEPEFRQAARATGIESTRDAYENYLESRIAGNV